jgi:SAM-dependent methyltransferase
MHVTSETVIDLYERRALEYDRDRSRSLQERGWLDRFLGYVPAAGDVLDLGCGTGHPIAAYLLDRGCRVVGVDSSPTMIALCRARMPDAEWHVADMRELSLGRRFDGILAWDSYFHLDMQHQRTIFARFAAHAAPGAALMFTTGPAEGESIGSCHGEPLYHASLAPGEYRRLLEQHGFALRAHEADDVACGNHTVWLATYDRPVAAR